MGHTGEEIVKFQDTAAFIAEELHGLACFGESVANNTVAKGFRELDPPLTREIVSTFTSNLHGEVSELWEAYRAGKLSEPCDKAEKMKAMGLVPLTYAEEEIADIIIRALDTANAIGVDVRIALAVKHLYNTTRERLHGGKKA